MFIEKNIFKIKNNTLILIEGDEKFKFIQGIISNDITLLKKKKSIYSSILTPQGRFIYDFFITYWKDNFLLECHKLNSEELLKKLKLYKLKSKVNFKIEDNFEIFLTNKSNLINLSIPLVKNSFSFPTHVLIESLQESMYTRKKSSEFYEQFNSISEKEFNNLRIANAIPDFRIDAIKNKSLLLEMRFDQLNGISWDKGCYMGQEITARMKYRNIIKKKIYSISIRFKNTLEKKIFSNNNEIMNCLVTINSLE